MAALKTHIALNVIDLEKSVTFYQAMLGTAPVKYKSDYAKFDLAEPGLNLTLNLSDRTSVQTPLTQGSLAHGTLSHLGIQVESTEAVNAAVKRFTQAGLNLFEEQNIDCCYAMQDKVWVTDPDGNRWEIFVVKLADTAPELNISTTQTEEKVACCG